jgi:hypothetical protein
MYQRRAGERVSPARCDLGHFMTVDFAGLVSAVRLAASSCTGSYPALGRLVGSVKAGASWKVSGRGRDSPVTPAAAPRVSAGTVTIAGAGEVDRRAPDYLHAYT